MPSLIWMGVIYYFSSQSTTGFYPALLPRFIFFKSLHLFEYAVLSIFFYFALLKGKNAIICAYLFALSDEIHQLFVSGRTGRFSDTLFDLSGIIIGLIILRQLRKIKAINKIFS
ncbi:MAG: VanZ family protein [Candidatus Shapirobacteria bacterium]|nr:VanZ family protein [Candidatus Woesebacteria bacterium]